MEHLVRCEVCGNEFPEPALHCPYCLSLRSSPPGGSRQPVYRTVNLEKGMPTVDAAVTRLRQELYIASQQGFRILILIHGYGSSGRGGAIKTEILRQLAFLKEQGRIHDFLPGDECDGRLGRGRELLRRFPILKRYLHRPNPGRSLVVI